MDIKVEKRTDAAPNPDSRISFDQAEISSGGPTRLDLTEAVRNERRSVALNVDRQQLEPGRAGVPAATTTNKGELALATSKGELAELRALSQSSSPIVRALAQRIDQCEAAGIQVTTNYGQGEVKTFNRQGQELVPTTPLRGIAKIQVQFGYDAGYGVEYTKVHELVHLAMTSLTGERPPNTKAEEAVAAYIGFKLGNPTFQTNGPAANAQGDERLVAAAVNRGAQAGAIDRVGDPREVVARLQKHGIPVSDEMMKPLYDAWKAKFG